MTAVGAADQARPYCYTCFKPKEVCICGHIVPVSHRTGILILQHVRERRHPVGTARIAKLALQRAELRIGYYEPPLVAPPPERLPADVALLYPSKRSRDLAKLPRAEHPKHLVVLDGTWRNVRTLYRKNRWLRDLPHVELRPSRPSRYRIRKAPEPGQLSTIEAIAEALRILEPDNDDVPRLLEMFDAMIVDQIRHMPPPEKPRFHQPDDEPEAPNE